jgi:hypothetical protein
MSSEDDLQYYASQNALNVYNMLFDSNLSGDSEGYLRIKMPGYEIAVFGSGEIVSIIPDDPNERMVSYSKDHFGIVKQKIMELSGGCLQTTCTKLSTTHSVGYKTPIPHSTYMCNIVCSHLLDLVSQIDRLYHNDPVTLTSRIRLIKQYITHLARLVLETPTVIVELQSPKNISYISFLRNALMRLSEYQKFGFLDVTITMLKRLADSIEDGNLQMLSWIISVSQDISQ